MSSLLKQIITVYPEYEEELSHIFYENEIFAELVNDYLFCKNKLKNNLVNTNNYKDALKNLEDEILEQIDMHKHQRNHN